MITEEKSLNLSPLSKPDYEMLTDQGNDYLQKLTLPDK
jgi:hypothetical protein